MVTFKEALDKILSHIQPLGSEKVSLLEALRRVMAEDIFTHRDIPPFDNSGMDGYAVKYSDIRNASKGRAILLKMAGELPAGSVSTRRLRKGQAIRIMTGASIPNGVDTVIPVEETEEKGGFVSILKAVPLGAYIRRAGEDVKKGDCIVSKGDFIRPAEIGMLASAGLSSISVYQRPLVAILCNGEELVDVDGDLRGVKIVSSNLYTLAAQVKDCGAIPIQLGIAKDRKGEIKEKLLQGLRADLIISSAGISAGDYDFVKDVLRDLGMKMVFWKVAMRPGKPLAFGTLRGKPVFGLPGNPASSMITFEQFVRPSLLKMMGHQQLFRPVVDAILKEDIHKEAGQRHFIRAFVAAKGNHYYATTTGGQGSGLSRYLMKTNGLVVISEDQEIVKAGEKVKVQLLSSSEYRVRSKLL